MSTPHFHSLTVADVRRETADCVSIAFALPAGTADAFRHTQGQYLNVRRVFGGEDIRRSYSICSGVDDGELRIAVKAVPGGAFSSWVNQELKPGDLLDVMPPEGRFHTPLDASHRKHYVAFAAGSGITPVLSLVKTVLVREPHSRVTLVYGNRTLRDLIFNETLEDLKDRYLGRLALYRVFSREPQEIALFEGRIDRAKVSALLDQLIPAASIDEAFVCGPDEMMEDVRAALDAKAVPAERIHIERFGVPVVRDPAMALAPAGKAASMDAQAKQSLVDVTVDGKRFSMALAIDGASVLDAALQAGADVPYACKAGVCCTCRAMLVEGEVRMDANYTLSDEEVRQGFRLTCQSHPVTARVVFDYDRR
jgi:ring-1,2-phenylacetyl-CoA epoxidase subunit PaaE